MTSPIKVAALQFISGITGTSEFLKQFVIEDPSYALNYGALVLKDGVPLMPGVPDLIFPVEKDEYVFLASKVAVDSFTDDEIAILQCYTLYMAAVVKEQELVLVTDNLILRTTKRMLVSIKADKALAEVFGPKVILDLWLKSIDISVNSQVLRDQAFVELDVLISDSNKDDMREYSIMFAKPKFDALYDLVATDPGRKSDIESTITEAINHVETTTSNRAMDSVGGFFFSVEPIDPVVPQPTAITESLTTISKSANATASTTISRGIQKTFSKEEAALVPIAKFRNFCYHIGEHIVDYYLLNVFNYPFYLRIESTPNGGLCYVYEYNNTDKNRTCKVIHDKSFNANYVEFWAAGDDGVSSVCAYMYCGDLTVLKTKNIIIDYIFNKELPPDCSTLK
jgi:hypothetical protein